MVLPFKRAEADAAATYTLYGKLPNRADFVRVNASHAVVSELDELIQQAFERLTAGDGWMQSYDESSAVEFQYMSRDFRHVLTGILAPSRDQAGRRYPLLAGVIQPAESIAGNAHIAPIAYELFFDGLREQVSTAMHHSVEALSCRQFLESYLRTNDNALSDLELAQGVVDRFMETTPAGRLHSLLALAPASGTLMQAILNIAFYRAFLRRFDNPATNQIILLPLPADSGERALIACAWLSMLSALWGGSRATQPWHANHLISQHSPNGIVLVASLGSASRNFVATMLGGPFDNEGYLDLCNEHDTWRHHQLYPEVSYALGRILADPALSISGLRIFLEDVGRKLDNAD